MTVATEWDPWAESAARLARLTHAARTTRGEADKQLLTGQLRTPKSVSDLMWRYHDLLGDLVAELDHQARLREIDETHPRGDQ